MLFSVNACESSDLLPLLMCAALEGGNTDLTEISFGLSFVTLDLENAIEARRRACFHPFKKSATVCGRRVTLPIL
jgi:hypothetical protein